MLGFSAVYTRDEANGQYRVGRDCDIIKTYQYHYYNPNSTGRNTEDSIVTIVNRSVNGLHRTGGILKVPEQKISLKHSRIVHPKSIV